jgi:hypothetical protein
MKKILNAVLFAALIQFGLIGAANAQITALPDAGNKRASVSEQVGLTDITIHYNRPHVRGREGHIWGELIPVGYVDQGFGPSKAAPWRAGANENTWIEFSTDVKIEGQTLPAGKYGFFVAYDPNECTVIFSKNYTSWGSFFYKPEEDALRVKIKPIPADKSVEWLKYEFTDQTPAGATIQLEWEKLIIPLKVEVDVISNQLASFRRELRSEKGFTWEAWDQAAAYCAQNKTNLDEALLWTDQAVSPNFGGSQSFQAWSTKAMVLDSLGRGTEAAEVMKKALPYGDIGDLYNYGRALIARKHGKEAVDVFKLNLDKHPGDYITVMGMARGYSAAGEYKKALEFAQKAEPLAQSKPRKDFVAKAIKSLGEGKDIN